MNYIFLDEVQNIKEFERAIDGLFIKKNVDLYITGSNAYHLPFITRYNKAFLSNSTRTHIFE